MIHGHMTFDGGVRGGNPGHAGFAAVIRLAGQEYVIARPLRGLNTNNVAEYMGLIVGAKYAAHLGVTALDIIGDSQLVVEQVNGRRKCKTEHIRVLCSEAQSVLYNCFPDDWTLSWVPRLENTVADAACAKAVLCAMNPWRVNRLDPFASRTYAHARTRAGTRTREVE
jgi:ribonuclease HI